MTKLGVTICLYGTEQYGFYCLANVFDLNGGNPFAGTMFGTCPEQGGKRYPTATTAIWTIQNEIIAEYAMKSLFGQNPITDAPVTVHMDVDHQPMVAKASMRHIPTFASLKWEDGTTYGIVISLAQVKTTAEKERS